MGKFAKEVILVGGGHTGVGIGAANQTKLKRVNPQIGLMAQALTQRRATVFILQHMGLFGRAKGNIALIPGLKIGKLIGRRQKWMGFPVPFYLGGFIDRLPARPLASI